MRLFLGILILILSLSSCSFYPGRHLLKQDEQAWSVNGQVLLMQEQAEKKDVIPTLAASYQYGSGDEYNLGLSFMIWPFPFLLSVMPYVNVCSLGQSTAVQLKHGLGYEFVFAHFGGSGFLTGPSFMHRAVINTTISYTADKAEVYLPLDLMWIRKLDSEQELVIMPGVGITSLGPHRWNMEYSPGWAYGLDDKDWKKAHFIRLGLTRVYTDP